MLGDVDSRTLFFVLTTTLSGLVTGVVVVGPAAGGEILTGESLTLVGDEEADLAVAAGGGIARREWV